MTGLSSVANIPAGLFLSARLLVAGLVDTLSVWRSLHFFQRCPGVAKNAVLILLANASLFSSLNAIVHMVVTPVSAYMEANAVTSVAQAKELLPLLTPMLGLLPLLLFSVAQGNAWYGDLADCVHRYRHKLHPEAELEKVTSDGTYALLVWLFTLVGVNLVPSALGQRLVDAATPYGLTHYAEYYAEALWLLGALAHCCIFAQYSFEIAWLSRGVGAEERFKALERRWEYFVGFGLPYVAVARCAPFFPGYAFYMVTYPVALTLACSSNPNRAYAASDELEAATTDEYADKKTQDNLHLLLATGPHRADGSATREKAVPRLLRSVNFYDPARLLALLLLGQLGSTQQEAAAASKVQEVREEEKESPRARDTGDRRRRSRSGSKARRPKAD